MSFFKSLYFAITILLLVISCSDKKDSNPLEAKNDAPVLEIIGFESNQLVFKEDTWYDFRFKAFDPDGNEPDVSLKVLNNTGEIKITDKSQDGLYLAQFKPFFEGEHEIEITVTDKVKTVSDKLNILMAKNQPPKAVLKIVAGERDIPNLKFSYNLDASESKDDDGEIKKVTWKIMPDNITVDEITTDNPQLVIDYTFADYGNYGVEVTIIDDAGATSTAIRQVDNSQPVALLSIRQGDTIRNNEEIQLDGSQSNSIHANIRNYKWFVNDRVRGLNVIGNSSEFLFSYTVRMTVGSNKVGLSIDDNEGNYSDTTWVSVLVENLLPVLSFEVETSLDFFVVTANDSYDPDPFDEISYNWYIDGQPLTNINDQKLPSAEVKGGVHILEVRVIDSNGGETGSQRI